MTLEGPNRPEPQSLTLGNKTTSIVVLDLSRRCENPLHVHLPLLFSSMPRRRYFRKTQGQIQTRRRICL